jgi:formate/nitrite transporter FocA (FNT family)
MTVLSLAVMGHAGDLSTIALASYNLLIVSFGNLVGGALLVATSYWVADRGVRGEKSNASQVVNTPLS